MNTSLESTILFRGLRVMGILRRSGFAGAFQKKPPADVGNSKTPL
jgi:hypothetical protein